jgi:alpha-soluble NSF attachment protein
MDNQHKEAGDSFCKAAEMALKNDEKDDAANDFWTASKSYKKSHPERESSSLSRNRRRIKWRKREGTSRIRTGVGRIGMNEGRQRAFRFEREDSVGDEEGTKRC